jgi:predicted metal-dependent hydrolase
MRLLTLKTPTGPLEYTITRRSRVTKRLHMELDEQGGLVIVAPGHWSEAYISATLRRNTSRVDRFIARARQRQLDPLRYVQGEQHLYLGIFYALTINHAPDKKNGVELAGQEIQVDARKNNADDIQSILQGWYRRQANRVFSERLNVVAQKADWTRHRSVPLKLRKMKRTWGNCSSSGVIKLNTHLVKAPLLIIDSVIAHELCHLEEMNHGRAFYALLESLNPNWRRDRVKLRSDGYIYFRT